MFHIYAIRKRKFKTVRYLLVWLEPKTEKIILVASENVKQEGLSSLLVGMQKWCSHLGK